MRKLKPEETYKKIDLDSLPSLENIPACEHLKQSRAEEAINFALEITNHTGFRGDFNIFVAGPSQAGKTTLAETLAKKIAQTMDIPPDQCYVYNFDSPEKATLLLLPAGQGKKLKRDLEKRIDHFLEKLKVESNQRDQAEKNIQEPFADFNKRAEPYSLYAGPASKQGQTIFGLWYIDKKNNLLWPKEDIVSDSQRFSPQEKEDILAAFEMFAQEFEQLNKKRKALERKLNKSLRNEKDIRDYKMNIIEAGFEKLREEYADNPKVILYLEQMENDIKTNLGWFDLSFDPNVFRAGFCPKCRMIGRDRCDIHGKRGVFSRYTVHLFVDNSELENAPVIVKNTIDFTDLFGRVWSEITPMDGGYRSNHTMTEAGALHQANGGILILKAQDIADPLVMVSPLHKMMWKRLTTALKNKEVKIKSASTGFEAPIAVPVVDPDPLPLNIRIILVGTNLYYQFLKSLDEFLEFSRDFGTRAQMESNMPLNEHNIRFFFGFIKHYCPKNHLALPDPGALAELIRFSCRKADNQNKLTLQTSFIKRVLKEAEHFRKKRETDNEKINAEDIKKAIAARKRRIGLYEDISREWIQKDKLKILTSGKKIGRINALAVLGDRDYCFGKPSTVTAVVSPGKKGIISIDREANMAGDIHEKGIKIISGFFKKTFGEECFPLSFESTICFEQNYSGIDGDSASSTELYLLLSALADVPIDQGIAVTGSINQHGEIQPIGGATEKVEGWFETCKDKGLTGNQGVIIPESNIENLNLSDEVVEAIAQDKFHIWPVSDITEGIKILTGMPFGNAKHRSDCIHKKVAKRLNDYKDKTKELMKKE